MSNQSLEKCDVLILSANYGAGHLHVSEALRYYINEIHPDWSIEIYDFFRLVDPLLSQVVEFGYQQVIKYFSPGYKLFYSATKEIAPDSNWQKHLNSIGQKEMERFIALKSPKVIVCTFPTPAGVVSELKGQRKINIPLITVITDVTVHSQWLHPYTDYYLVAADIVAQNMEFRGIPKEKIFVTGMPLRPQFEKNYDKCATFQKYGLDTSLPTVLISGGGKGMLGGSIDIIRKLGRVKPPIQIVIVTGNNKALARRLQLLSRTSRNPILILGFIENMAELMQSCDMMITKAGGITIFEAMEKKIPMILYKSLPGHEEANVHFLLQNGAARSAKNWRQIKNIMEELLYIPEISAKMVSNGFRIAKPSASRRAAAIIAEAALGHKVTAPRQGSSTISDSHWRYA